MPSRLTEEALGRRIRKARLGLKVPKGQRWLADRVGVSQPTICRWEQGLRTISTRDLLKVARVLGQDVRDLLYR